MCMCLSVQRSKFLTVAWLGQLFTIEVFYGNITNFSKWINLQKLYLVSYFGRSSSVDQCIVDKEP